MIVSPKVPDPAVRAAETLGHSLSSLYRALVDGGMAIGTAEVLTRDYMLHLFVRLSDSQRGGA